MDGHQVVHFHRGFTLREGLYRSRAAGGELLESITEICNTLLLLGFIVNFQQGGLLAIHAVFEEFPGDVGLVGVTVTTDRHQDQA